MELTECICSKIEEMRQKKSARFQQASSQAEKHIAVLTQRRSSLFEALETEMQAQALPTLSTNLESPLTRPTASGKGQADVHKDLLNDPDDEDESVAHRDPRTADDDDGRKHSVLEFSDIDNPTQDASTDLTSAIPTPDPTIRLLKLREEASRTDNQLHEERLYLQNLRTALAASLCRLDQLEAQLCLYSEEWEQEERARLSMNVQSSTSLKRKRSSTFASDEPYAVHKKVVRRAMETLVIFGLGAGLAAAKQAYL